MDFELLHKYSADTTWALEAFGNIAKFPCCPWRNSAESCPSPGSKRKLNFGHFCPFAVRAEGDLEI